MQDILISNPHPATNPVICKYLQPSGLLKLILAFSAMAEAWARYSSGQNLPPAIWSFFPQQKKENTKEAIPFHSPLLWAVQIPILLAQISRMMWECLKCSYVNGSCIHETYITQLNYLNWLFLWCVFKTPTGTPPHLPPAPRVVSWAAWDLSGSCEAVPGRSGPGTPAPRGHGHTWPMGSPWDLGWVGLLEVGIRIDLRSIWVFKHMVERVECVWIFFGGKWEDLAWLRFVDRRMLECW